MITVVGAVIMRGDHVLAARRSTPPVGNWEFPGGKVEPGEEDADALQREILEELGVRIEVVGEVAHPDAPWRINANYSLRLFLAVEMAGEPLPGDSHDELQWVHVDDLAAIDWLPSDQLALDAVAAAVAAHRRG